jgi:hypothetical protein
MPLAAGEGLGPYEIVGRIGAGGMGEVYRARDSKLDRNVALKILPPAFASHADGMARFRREAQVLAALNHPRIAAIYGLEDSGPVTALVTELVDGPTLDSRISSGCAAGGRSAAHRARDRRSRGVRAREGHHPSRSQARRSDRSAARYAPHLKLVRQ